MGLTNLTALGRRFGEGQIFKFLTSLQRGPKRAPVFFVILRDTGLLFPPCHRGIARICLGRVRFSILPPGADRGVPKVDPKFRRFFNENSKIAPRKF